MCNGKILRLRDKWKNEGERAREGERERGGKRERGEERERGRVGRQVEREEGEGERDEKRHSPLHAQWTSWSISQRTFLEVGRHVKVSEREGNVPADLRGEIRVESKPF